LVVTDKEGGLSVVQTIVLLTGCAVIGFDVFIAATTGDLLLVQPLLIAST
jgi:hypothetical protein